MGAGNGSGPQFLFIHSGGSLNIQLAREGDWGKKCLLWIYNPFTVYSLELLSCIAQVLLFYLFFGCTGSLLRHLGLFALRQVGFY